MKDIGVAYYHDILNRLKWHEVYRGGGWILYDVYYQGKHVGALLFGRERDGKRYYRGIMYTKGRSFYSRNLRNIEMMLAAPFLNPNC